MLLLFLCISDLYSQPQRNPLVLETGSAFNRSNLKWSIAGNLDGYSPNILSELIFNDITSLGYYLRGNYTPVKYLTFTAYYQQGKVLDGNGFDTDYSGDNRTNPTFEGAFTSDKGNLTILEGGMGSTIQLSDKINITPSLSYYLTKQKFYLLNPKMQDLRSSYQVDMQGIEISAKGNIYLNKIIHFSLAVSYRFVDYQAEANWNLRDIFQHPLSFSHDAEGSGFGLDAAIGANINKRFSVIISGVLNATTISEGTDTAYLITGNEVVTQFNGAENVLYGLRVGVNISI